jgi:multidrug efflux pump subunit AcrA (membrane-fusion protein)
VGTTENVLTIPVAALNQRGSRSFVYTGFDSEKRTLTDPVDVELGVSDGQTVEVLGGLNEGDRVWYSYYETEALPILFTGQSVDNA